MKKNLFRTCFNLIEVTMAIAIVGIGIAGVMALFPPAIEANKTANFQNFTGTLVDNIAVYLGYELKRNWSTFKGNFKVKSSAFEPEPQTNIETTDGATEDKKVGWKTMTGFPGIFQPYDKNKNLHSDWLGLKSEDGSIAAHVRIWKEPNDKLSKGYFNGAGSGSPAEQITFGDDYRIRLVIELSWPIAKAYADREKQEFVYEFNKPE